MTEQESLALAAEEILKKEREVLNSASVANMITSGTTASALTQRNKDIERLEADAIEYEKVFRKPNEATLKEIDRLKGISHIEKVEKETLGGVMAAIEFSNKVDETRASFTDEASFNVFNRGIKEVGADVFMAAYEKAGNNVFQAIADVNGVKDIFELQERDAAVKKDKQRVINPSKDDEMIERIAQRTAEILRGKK